MKLRAAWELLDPGTPAPIRSSTASAAPGPAPADLCDQAVKASVQQRMQPMYEAYGAKPAAQQPIAQPSAGAAHRVGHVAGSEVGSEAVKTSMAPAEEGAPRGSWAATGSGDMVAPSPRTFTEEVEVAWVAADARHRRMAENAARNVLGLDTLPRI